MWCVVCDVWCMRDRIIISTVSSSEGTGGVRTRRDEYDVRRPGVTDPRR